MSTIMLQSIPDNLGIFIFPANCFGYDTQYIEVNKPVKNEH